MEQFVCSRITGNPNIKSKVVFAEKGFLLYAPTLGGTLLSQNETEAHSNLKECVQSESV